MRKYRGWTKFQSRPNDRAESRRRLLLRPSVVAHLSACVAEQIVTARVSPSLTPTSTFRITSLDEICCACVSLAFQLLHKLPAATVRPYLAPIGTDLPVEMDLTLVSGRNKGGGSGKTTKAAVAVEVRRKEQRD